MTFCTIDDLKKVLEAPEENIFFLDVRSPEEYKEGHIARFVNVPIGSDDEAFAPYLRGIVYVICDTHGRSQRVAKKLDEQGVERVAVVHGGMFTWAIHDNPVE